ncbi:hypothetical protein MCA1235 [Methylococcus capsulatus str. Bath]|uniref:Uncharacterized protein n=1 Tax=Methylococcus capsulatus (strain ATCC 33009 / NCIMB 11132 / Bath) TaxID=243233 RepID=Q609J8_METCA|nr:hypothetical protein MCA1235 [Methylococcus capsulatus str. Bath]
MLMCPIATPRSSAAETVDLFSFRPPRAWPFGTRHHASPSFTPVCGRVRSAQVQKLEKRMQGTTPHVCTPNRD